MQRRQTCQGTPYHHISLFNSGWKLQASVIGKSQMPQAFSKQLPWQIDLEGKRQVLDDWSDISRVPATVQQPNAVWESKCPCSSRQCSLPSRDGALQCQACFPVTKHDCRNPTLGHLVSSETSRSNIERCFLSFSSPMKTWRPWMMR